MSYLQLIGKNRIPENHWEKEENVIKFLIFVSQQLNYKNCEDWYKCSRKMIENFGGREIFNHHKNIVDLLNKIYKGRYEFLEWKFVSAISGFWNSEDNCIKYMKWLEKELGYTKEEDWYQINSDILRKNYGNGMVNNSRKYAYYNILKKIYPEYNWLPWKFTRASDKFWEDINNQRKYMEWLFKKLNYINIEDWSKIGSEEIINNCGGAILRRYKTLFNLFQQIYPEHNWVRWNFDQCPDDFWKIEENRISYKNWLFKRLNLTGPEGWYQINRDIIKDNNGYGFIKYYVSFYNCVKTFEPEYDWLFWKFTRVPDGFWEEFENQKKYMNWLFKELGYTEMEDWYKISQEDLRNNEGHGILNFESENEALLVSFLNKVYPNYNFLPWKFISVGQKYWNNEENVKSYMDWLFKELNYSKMEDWYSINNKNFSDNCGTGILAKYDLNYKKLLKEIYPDYKWDKNKFKAYKGELICKRFLESLYNEKEITQGYRVKWCKNPETNRFLPFDFCLSNFNIIIEIDGIQHFEDLKGWRSVSKENRIRDRYKMTQALQNGYSVIRILWDDIYYDTNDWKNKLKDSIQELSSLQESPRVIYLSDKYKEFEEYNSIIEIKTNGDIESYESCLMVRGSDGKFEQCESCSG